MPSLSTPTALWAAHWHTAPLLYGCPVSNPESRTFPDPAPTTLSLSHFASCQLSTVLSYTYKKLFKKFENHCFKSISCDYLCLDFVPSYFVKFYITLTGAPNAAHKYNWINEAITLLTSEWEKMGMEGIQMVTTISISVLLAQNSKAEILVLVHVHKTRPITLTG